MNKQYIVSVKQTYQTSEDTWERATLTKLISDDTTIAEIMQWVSGKNADKNTIMIHPLD